MYQNERRIYARDRELVSERTREKKRGGEWEEGREERSCITLNLPEYLPSEPYDATVCIRSPMHMAPKRVLSPLSFSPTILFTPASLSLFDSPRLLHYPARSFARTNLARPFSLLPFLFLLRLLLELTHPFLTLCTVYRVSA